jgi:hypothetical protein
LGNRLYINQRNQIRKSELFGGHSLTVISEKKELETRTVTITDRHNNQNSQCWGDIHLQSKRNLLDSSVSLHSNLSPFRRDMEMTDLKDASRTPNHLRS